MSLLIKGKRIEPHYILQLLAETHEPVQTINYKTNLKVRLLKEEIFDKGALINVQYFTYALDEDSEYIKDRLVINVDIVYKRDDNGKVISRVTTRSYTGIHTGDEYGPDFKETYKEYNNLESYKEIKRRRKNVIDFLLSFLDNFIALDEGYVDVLDICKPHIQNFIDTGSNELIAEITTSTLEMLDMINPLEEGNTVRETLINQLSLTSESV